MQPIRRSVKGQSVFFYVALGLAVFANAWMSLIAYIQYSWYPGNSFWIMMLILFTLLFSIFFKFYRISLTILALIIVLDFLMGMLMFRLINNETIVYQSIVRMDIKDVLIASISFILLGLDWANRLLIIRRYSQK
ncbi:MAG: hypothetical protein WAQ28_11530 [Bacteroidia bacterium]|jgi:hypothetical protein